MRSTLALMLVVSIGASPCLAQSRVTSLDELRRHLATGDSVTIVPQEGPVVDGRLTRIGSADLDVRTSHRRLVTIPLEGIQSLERPRDSSANGAMIGAGIGAGVGGALFLNALIIDRNELDEWGPLYGGMAATCAGVGALVGWAVDRARSKPPIRFDRSREPRAVSVRPFYSSRSIGATVSVAY